jgi:adenylate kinase family enzyme
MKVLVTGNAGSGKSTVSKQLATDYEITYYSLDTIVWKEGWQKTLPQEKDERINELIAKEDWVIDGVSNKILEAADQVIFLDFPRRVCFYRAAKRNTRYLFSSRPELPANCLEILIIPTLIKIIWNFPKKVRPRLIEEKSRRGNSFIQVKNNKELRMYLSSIR